MSNYISAVTLASPTAVASPSAPHAVAPKSVQKPASDDQDAQVTLSSAALALSQSNSTDSSGGSSALSSSLATTDSNNSASTDTASSAAAKSTVHPVAPETHHAKFVDPHEPHEDSGTAAQVKLSTAAQVLSMTQTGASVDEIAAVLGMSVSDVSEELGISSPLAAAVAAQTTAAAAVHA